MGIGQDIQQKEFRSESQKILINILYTRSHIIEGLSQIFKKQHITLQQYNVLRILNGMNPKPATVRIIKERMMDKMCDASRIVDRLVGKGLIDRNSNKYDRRAVDVLISKSGKDLLASIDPEIISFEEELNGLSPEETVALNDLLDKFRKPQ